MSTRDDDSTPLIAGLEPYIRTSITDRVHDGIYDTDTAHKSTLGGRVKRGEIRSPDICRHGTRFGDAPVGLERQQVLLQNVMAHVWTTLTKRVGLALFSHDTEPQDYGCSRSSRFMNPR